MGFHGREGHPSEVQVGARSGGLPVAEGGSSSCTRKVRIVTRQRTSETSEKDSQARRQGGQQVGAPSRLLSHWQAGGQKVGQRDSPPASHRSCQSPRSQAASETNGPPANLRAGEKRKQRDSQRANETCSQPADEQAIQQSGKAARQTDRSSGLAASGAASTAASETNGQLPPGGCASPQANQSAAPQGDGRAAVQDLR